MINLEAEVTVEPSLENHQSVKIHGAHIRWYSINRCARVKGNRHFDLFKAFVQNDNLVGYLELFSEKTWLP